MHYLLALVIAALSAWVITAIGSGTIERAVSAFGLLVGGWRPDPWPRGVQEEDRDRPWGARLRRVLHGASAAYLEDRTPSVRTARIHARTRSR